jgi:hypothetical protein
MGRILKPLSATRDTREYRATYSRHIPLKIIKVLIIIVDYNQHPLASARPALTRWDAARQNSCNGAIGIGQHDLITWPHGADQFGQLCGRLIDA